VTLLDAVLAALAARHPRRPVARRAALELPARVAAGDRRAETP